MWRGGVVPDGRIGGYVEGRGGARRADWGLCGGGGFWGGGDRGLFGRRKVASREKVVAAEEVGGVGNIVSVKFYPGAYAYRGDILFGVY